MFTATGTLSSPITFEKNLVTDQTFTGLTVKLNTAGRTFTSNGLGTTTATSTLVLVNIGGFADQEVTATMKYIAPTTAGLEEIGVMARVQTLDATADEDYYYARVYRGEARLTKVIGGVLTTISSSPFLLPQDTDCTITLRVIGSALTAIYTSAALSTVTLSAVDTDIEAAGMMGFRTRVSTGFCSLIEAQQLPGA